MIFVNQNGSCFKSAYTECKKRELIAKGYIPVEENVAEEDPVKAIENKPAAKKPATRNPKSTAKKKTTKKSVKKPVKPVKEEIKPVGDGVEIEI